MSELGEQIGALEKQFKAFTIRGAGGIGVHGSMKHGFVVSGEGGGGEGGGGGGETPAEPTGACCVDSDCSITTEADCAGTYQGDDTVCDPNPCSGVCCVPLETDGGPTHCSLTPLTEVECADVPGSVFLNPPDTCDNCPSCPQVVIAVDSISLTRTKCGFTLIGPGQQYYQSAIDCGYTLSGPTAPAVWLHINEPCCDATMAGCNVSHDGVGDCEDWDPITCTHLGYCTESGECCDCVNACDPEADPGCTDFHTSDCQTDFHLSNEYLTSDLIDRTYADMVAYSGAYSCSSGQDCICHGGSCGSTLGGCTSGGGTYVSYDCFIVATRDLAAGERQFTITRFQYKFQFYDFETGGLYTGCPFRLDWKLIFVPEGGSEADAVITPMSATFAGGISESDVYELLEPGVDGTNTLSSDVVCTPTLC